MALLSVRKPVSIYSTLLYGSSKFANTSDFVKFENIGRSRWFHPRHISTTRSVNEERISKKQVSSPLSVLSNSTLMRSLFLSTISSTPWLLTPAISFLSLLCRAKKSAFLDVGQNKLLAWMMKKTIYNQFCAGETSEEVNLNLKRMKELGFEGTILTYAQETVFDHNTEGTFQRGVDTTTRWQSNLCPGIQLWANNTLQTVDMLGQGDQLAVKVTGAGPSVTRALAAGELPPQQMLDALDQISTKCREKKVRILVDAESQFYQPGIHRLGLFLIRKYNTNGRAVIYNTYQAYLKSTPVTLSQHLAAAENECFTLGIKLVRGAYLSTDPRNLIHDTKKDTDDAYNNIAHGLLRQQIFGFGRQKERSFPSVDVILAGHNQESIFSAYNIHQQRVKEGLPITPLGFAQLHGMADEVSLRLIQLKGRQSLGPKVYKCSTWGTLEDCLGYLFRRATENREAASRTLDGLIALRSEARRRILSLFSPAKQNQSVRRNE